jgi:hypothetical protein
MGRDWDVQEWGVEENVLVQVGGSNERLENTCIGDLQEVYFSPDTFS